MTSKLKKITSRNNDFVKWYTDIIINSNLINYGPIKGTMFLKPYGYAIWENIQKKINKIFLKNNIQNVYFPMLIPRSLFNLEKQHIKGFSPELLSITKVGDKILNEELYIRPTSEIIFSSFFSKEIKSYKDLPLLYNQWTNVIRWEKTTRPFLRTNEFLWQEGHSVHQNLKDSKKFVLKILDIYSNFFKKVLLLPIIKGKKTDLEKFAGSLETYTLELFMKDGHFLQCATSHYFGQNFSKSFNIKFINKENRINYAYSTSWGMSTRIIGAIIMNHSDDNGLVLPPLIAPIQIIIILVENNDFLLKKSLEIKNILKKYRVFIDNSEKSFGSKIYDAEIKGIPIRIELGNLEFKNDFLTIVRRDNFEKTKINIKDIKNFIKKANLNISKNLYNSSFNFFKNNKINLNNFNKYKEILKNSKNNKLFFVPFCGNIICEKEIKLITNTSSRCISINKFSFNNKNNNCFKCKSPSKFMVYFGKSY